MKKVVINGQLINYLANSEQNKKPAILFLHGWRVDGSIWAQAIEMLRNEGITNDIYAIDFPGFGGSSAPAKDFTLSDYCDIVEQFIGKLQLGKIILIGHSFGGRVAIKLSATKPELAEKVVLVDSAGFVIHQAKKKAMNTAAKLVKPFFSAKFMKPLREKIYKQIGAEDYLATPHLQKTYVNIINEDLTHYLPKMPGPTLIIWGANDIDTPLDYARKMSQDIHHSQMVVLENAGHFCFQDKPEEFVKNLKEFISHE